VNCSNVSLTMCKKMRSVGYLAYANFWSDFTGYHEVTALPDFPAYNPRVVPDFIQDQQGVAVYIRVRALSEEFQTCL
jgi:hypothetical protein